MILQGKRQLQFWSKLQIPSSDQPDQPPASKSEVPPVLIGGIAKSMNEKMLFRGRSYHSCAATNLLNSKKPWRRLKVGKGGKDEVDEEERGSGEEEKPTNLSGCLVLAINIYASDEGWFWYMYEYDYGIWS